MWTTHRHRVLPPTRAMPHQPRRTWATFPIWTSFLVSVFACFPLHCHKRPHACLRCVTNRHAGFPRESPHQTCTLSDHTTCNAICRSLSTSSHPPTRPLRRPLRPCTAAHFTVCSSDNWTEGDGSCSGSGAMWRRGLHYKWPAMVQFLVIYLRRRPCVVQTRGNVQAA